MKKIVCLFLALLLTLSAAGAMALGIFAATMLFRLLFTVGRAVCSAVRRAH